MYFYTVERTILGIRGQSRCDSSCNHRAYVQEKCCIFDYVRDFGQGGGGEGEGGSRITSQKDSNTLVRPNQNDV